MSETTTRSSAQPNVQEILRVVPRLMDLSMESATMFARQASQVLRPVMPSASFEHLAKTATSMLRPKSMCDVPETDCPPRCVCDINWDVCHGDTATCTIRVTNTGRTGRVFQVSATPLSGPGNAGAVNVSAATLDLAAGESGTVTATYTAPEGTASGTYRGEILIRGAYEQCVRVAVDVTGKRAEQSCHCEVQQGEPPKRIRAHHWYDHFQCEEDCFPQIKGTASGTTVPGTTVPRTNEPR